jgi:phosphatidylserine/phosphatidylglycerophosphate/cardiolipin synthase-like enzyme
VKKHIQSCMALVVSLAICFGSSSATAKECSPQMGKSPEGSGTELVDQAIDSARSSIRLAAYSFTSPDIVSRLINAKRRGVDVAVLVDEKENSRSKAAIAALNLLVTNGIPTRTVGVYPIFHDKYFVVDVNSIETGSYNYSSAARRNSENAIVLWDCPSMAKLYLEDWNSRWPKGSDYRSMY